MSDYVDEINGEIVEEDSVSGSLESVVVAVKEYTFTNGLSESDDTVTANLADTTPNMDGTASAGTSTNISRADHTHPTDTSRASATDLTTHTSDTSNPHSVTKAQVGLGNVDNTSDADKPISTATQTALNTKQETLVSGTNIKTINNTSILGEGNIDIQSAVWGNITGTLSNQTDLATALGEKASASDLTSHTSNTNNPHSVTKAQVGLGNADNTSDLSKPISTATQTALDAKQDKMQLSTMPNADASYVGKVVQYIGTTTTDYTHNYFYECENQSIQESITAVENDDLNILGDITIDSTKLKSKLSAGTYTFHKYGYPKKIKYTSLGLPMTIVTLTRDSVFDNSLLNIYSWVGDDNNYYVTDTLRPNSATKLYNYDTTNGSIGTDTGYTYMTLVERDNASGYWTLSTSNSTIDAEPYDYGIILSVAGFPDNEILVTYIAASNSYSWVNKDVQSVTKEKVGLGNVTNDAQVKASEKGVANGVATLDSGAKVPMSQLPDVILGQLLYGGDVTTNAVASLSVNAKSKLGTTLDTITLTNDTTAITGYEANEGIYYIAQAAFSFAGKLFATGDWLISRGNAWDKVANTDAVTSVAGKIGAVTLDKNDVGLSNVDNTSDLSKPISTATQTALDAKQNSLPTTTTAGQVLKSTSTAGTVEWGESSGGGAWGSITGTLSNQTDLQTALDGKADVFQYEYKINVNNTDTTNKYLKLFTKDYTANQIVMVDISGRQDVSGGALYIPISIRFIGIINKGDATDFLLWSNPNNARVTYSISSNKLNYFLNAVNFKGIIRIYSNYELDETTFCIPSASLGVNNILETYSLASKGTSNAWANLQTFNGRIATTLVNQTTNIDAPIVIGGNTSTTTAANLNQNTNFTYNSSTNTLKAVNTQISGNISDGTNTTTVADLIAKQDPIQYDTMPTASADLVGAIVQFTGTTDSTYTNGYFYKCVDNGDTTYSWSNINVQAASGSSVTVEDNLTSTSTTNALSANQGRVLNEGKLDKATPTSEQGNKEFFYTFAGSTQKTDIALVNDITSTPSAATDDMVATARSVVTAIQNVAIPTTSTAGKVLKSTATAGTVEWGDSISSLEVAVAEGESAAPSELKTGGILFDISEEQVGYSVTISAGTLQGYTVVAGDFQYSTDAGTTWVNAQDGTTLTGVTQLMVRCKTSDTDWDTSFGNYSEGVYAESSGTSYGTSTNLTLTGNITIGFNAELA